MVFEEGIDQRKIRRRKGLVFQEQSTQIESLVVRPAIESGDQLMSVDKVILKGDKTQQ
jgi:hypothetical protein